MRRRGPIVVRGGYLAEPVERRLLLSSASALPPNVECNLAALYAELGSAPGAAAVGLASPLQIDSSGRPLVDVWTSGSTATVAQELADLGEQAQAEDDQYHLVEAWINLADLPRVAALGGVLSVTPVYKPITCAGSVMTQGDAVIHGDAVRNPPPPQIGYDGSGVLVGAMSDSALNLAASQATGNLPPVVDRYLEFPATDEGRAMLEIVHDVAPGRNWPIIRPY